MQGGAVAARPPPGRRLDLLRVSVVRCEGRAEKAGKLAEASQKAPREAEAPREKAQQDHRGAK
eukprot:11175705-Lingulodinium_polyedra.AAC.1